MVVYQPVITVRDFSRTNRPPYYSEEEKKVNRLFDNKEAALKCAEDYGSQFEYVSDVNYVSKDAKEIEIESKFEKE